MTRLVRGVLLLVVWLALWSDLSVANVLSGVLVAAAIVAGFDTWQAGRVIVRPVHAARFVLWFAYKLVESTLVVARAVISPGRRVYTGIISVPLKGCSDVVATVIGDAISLTPGTLTLEVQREPLVLYIHALDTRDLDVIRSDVRKLEVLAVRAFGDDDALAGLDVDDSSGRRTT